MRDYAPPVNSSEFLVNLEMHITLSKIPNFLVKSTFEHKTTKSSHKMPNPVKKTENGDFQYF